MWLWLKHWIAKYDAWCQSMGLTPGKSAVVFLIEKIRPMNETIPPPLEWSLFDTHCHFDFPPFTAILSWNCKKRRSMGLGGLLCHRLGRKIGRR